MEEIELNSNKTPLKNNVFKSLNGIYKIKKPYKIENIFNKTHFCFNHKIKNSSLKKEKIRNPGVDVVRIIAMYLIVFNHLLSGGNGYKKYHKYENFLQNIHICTNWNNNGFALISGVVGFNSNKYSNLLYLWLMVYFYSVGIHLYVQNYQKGFKINYDISIDYFPIIFKRYWYFTAYFGMYLFLPVINKGISCLTKSEFRLVIFSIIGIFVFWRDFKNSTQDVFNMNDGNSMIWLLINYLTGAYIGKYRVDYSGLKKYIYCFICILIYIFSSYLYIKAHNNQLYLGKRYYQKELVNFIRRMLTKRSDSFLTIAQSITASLFFLQIKYNKYIAKVICFIGPLCFGVYLVHTHPILVENLLRNIFNKDPEHLSLNSMVILILLKALKIYVFCIIIDYFRNFIFTLLRIRKFCVFLEENLKKLFS